MESLAPVPSQNKETDNKHLATEKSTTRGMMMDKPGRQIQVSTITIPYNATVSMSTNILTGEVACMNSFKQDSIVDMYCDDELRMSLEYDEHHLGLGPSEELAVYDLLDDELLPTTVTNNLEYSLGEIQEYWGDNSDTLAGTQISQEEVAQN